VVILILKDVIAVLLEEYKPIIEDAKKKLTAMRDSL